MKNFHQRHLFLLIATLIFSFARLYANEDKVFHHQFISHKKQEAKEISNPTYQALKPYHIQQDKRDGCSLATSLVLINHLRKIYLNEPQLTQQQMREWLKVQPYNELKTWVKRVSGQGLGVSFDQLNKYLSLTLEEMNFTDVKISAIRKSSTQISSFRQHVKETIQTPGQVMLINFAGHWSPLGHYEESSDTVVILDVDYVQKYTQEFTYLPGQGEYRVSVKTLFNQKMKNRGYLLVNIPVYYFD